MSQVKELQERFNKALHDAQEVRKKYEGVAGNMTPEEEERYDKFLNEADGLKAQIQRLQKEGALEDWRNKLPENPLIADGRRDDPASNKMAEARARAIHKKYLLGGAMSLTGEERGEYDAYLQKVNPGAFAKAYQADNPAGGGFAVPPQEMVQEFLTLMKDLVFIRGLGTVYEIPTAESLGVPAIDTDPSDTDWTAELAVGNEETTAAVGKREFRPNPLAKYIKLSKKLLRQVTNFETVIMDRLAYKVAITEEKAFLIGTGANQPLGVYVASANGISTARDTTAAGASAIAPDDVINTFYNLKAQYRARAVWVIHRTVILTVRKLKDTTNNYLWSAGYGAQGKAEVTGPGGGMQYTPDTLMGRPVMESEYAPNTITTGLYTMLVGDFSKYWIADALDMQIQVLYELFALSNQMGYILRKETDGMPVLEEAFSRLKQA